MKNDKSPFPVIVKRGSVSVRIYQTPSHNCARFTVCYYQDGQRKRASFSTLEDAKAEAEIVATRLTSTEAAVLKLTGADLSAYQRARQHLDPLGVPIEIAAAQYSEALRRLCGISISQAVEFYLQRNPKKIEARSVQNVINEFIAIKEADGLSERYIQSLRWALPKFACAFRQYHRYCRTGCRKPLSAPAKLPKTSGVKSPSTAKAGKFVTRTVMGTTRFRREADTYAIRQSDLI